jgi:glucoamylase
MEAERLLAALESFASYGSMIPEQVWDAADIPEKELFFGRPSGSAMPLVWAHAEHIKLRRSLFDKAVFDMPPQTVERYQIARMKPKHHGWRATNKCGHMPAGLDLRIELRTSSKVHWSDDGWQTVHDAETVDTGLGIYVCDLPAAKLKPGRKIVFTWMSHVDNKWAGVDYNVEVVAATQEIIS